MDLFLTWILCAVVGLILYIKYKKMQSSYTYWQKRNIPVSSEPNIFLGNDTHIFGKRIAMGKMYKDLYLNTRKAFPFFGRYSITNPVFIANDLDLIKSMLTKDFIHFTDHNGPVDEDRDPLQNHLFSLTGEKWKTLRVKLTPTFTTSKIKYMFQTIADCNKELLKHLNRTINETNSSINVKEVYTILNTDVIGSCAFGIETNSFTNPGQFLKMGKLRAKQTAISKMTMLKFLFPRIFGKGALPRTEKEVEDFFYGIVEKTIKYRIENNVTRNDFMQLIIQLKKDGSVQDDSVKEPQKDDGVRLTMMQCAAQVFVFFIAGFETSSTTASFCLYELALNPDIQDTLAAEIDDVLYRNDDKITYEALQEMSYLSMVIDETLRKYPPLPILMRICTKPYVIPGTDAKLDKGTQVIIPILGIHNDPDFFPNPEKFDPERFTPENKASRPHFSYLPFGEGPRVCIGNRFGLVQTKLGLVTLLSNYSVSVCDKTPIPMVFSPTSFVLATEDGLWLKLTPREKKH